MKPILITCLCLASMVLRSQNQKVDFDGGKWEAPYTLAFPKGWDVERFLIPIEFAPSIPYKGVEDIRFTPGWGNVKSEEYWSYAFLWYLTETPSVTAKIAADNLTAYYTGLIGRNITPRKIPKEKLFPVRTMVKPTSTSVGDIKTFTGSIDMLDYMEQKPITLHCIIHIKSCPDRSNGFIFTEISPKPFTDKIWDSLNQLWTDFQCDNATTKPQ